VILSYNIRVIQCFYFLHQGTQPTITALWVLPSALPWQADGAQVGERVVHQLQLLHADEPTEDPKEIVPLEGISEVLVGQIQLLGGQDEQAPRMTRTTVVGEPREILLLSFEPLSLATF